MKYTPFPRFVLAIFALSIFLVPASFAQNNGKLKRSKRAIPNSYIVVLEDDVDMLSELLPPVSRRRNVKRIADDLAVQHGGRVDKVYETAIKGFSVEMSAERAEALSRDPRVKYVEEDFEVFAEETQPGATWGIDRIDQRTLPLDTNYNYLTTGTGVHAYVIDSGIRSSHLEFGGRVVFGGDWVNDGRNGNDCDGHGTHVAGTIGSATYGVAKNVTLHNLRVLGCDGRGTGTAILAAINWVSNNRVLPAVANFSIGMDGISTTVESAIANSISRGVNYSLAAGNDNVDACNHSPGGRVPTAVTVGASDAYDWKSDFSNYGPCLDIFAPGTDILSTLNSSDSAVGYASGTSMAAPHVAGVMARLLEASPTSSPADIKTALLDLATNRILAPGDGSPIRLLYIPPGFEPPPPPKIILTPDISNATSILTVSGLEGVISSTPGSVRLRLTGLSHTYPADLSIVLVSPGGIAFAVQGYSGGTVPVNNVNYSISDAGIDLIPVGTVANGTDYKPTVRNSPINGDWAIPVPHNPGPAGGGNATFSSTFGDLNPNGQWKLYVKDLWVHPNDRGVITDWSLEIITAPIPPDQNPAPPPGGSIGFVGYDSFTKGNWPSKYGSEANVIFCFGGKASPWIRINILNASSRCFSDVNGDDRALIREPSNPNRSLGEYFSSTQFDMQFEATDGRAHRVALYFVDFQGKGRQQTIELFDTDTGQLIDTRTLSNFRGGRYLIWQLRGRVTIRITNNGGTNLDAIFNGYFIDPLPSDAPVPPPDENSVGRFLGFDTTSQGTWVGKYGVEGQIISYDTAQEFAPWAGYHRVGPATFPYSKWADSTTDVRSLQKSGDPNDRIDAQFNQYDSKDVGLSFNITDGKPHRLAVYFLGYRGTPNQTYRLEIIDANGNVVDRQLLSGHQDGVYAAWEVKGRFTLWITNLGPGTDLRFSGIFLDPVDGNEPSPTPRINYAHRTNGGVARASSINPRCCFTLWSTNDGERRGVNFGSASTGFDNGWSDNTPDAFPDRLQIDFSSTRRIHEIDVFTVRDDYTTPADPTEDMTFSMYGLRDFDVQYWNGSTWETVPGGSITNNTNVWRKITFEPIATKKIRVWVNNALSSSSRIVEVEAWSGGLASSPTPTPTPTPSPTPLRTNVALAANGGVASASSQWFNNCCPVAAAINGDRTGVFGWNNGRWADGTPNVFPDWLQVTFNGPKAINEISVITMQDNYNVPIEPELSDTFSVQGITNFNVQYWDGSAWVNVPGGSITNNDKVWTQLIFSEITTDKIRVEVNATVSGYTNIVELEAWTGGNPPPTPTPTPTVTPSPTPTATPTPAPTPADRTNYALPANGGVASVSSQHSAPYPAASLNNGDRMGLNWGNGGGWNDNTAAAYPDWAEIAFDTAKPIYQVDVFTVQDNYGAPSEPTSEMTFGSYGVTDFVVQYWDGSGWADVPGGTVTANNKVWRRIQFAPIETQKVRVQVNASLQQYSRLVEIEAWGETQATPTPTPEPTPTPDPSPTPGERTNFALAANGGIASASSQHSSSYPASSLTDSDRKGLNWAAGGGWNDNTSDVYPDWVEVAFDGARSIDEIDVFTVQDSYGAPAEPTSETAFGLYGVTEFEVQYWTGTAWQTVPDGHVTGNNKVWRRFTFAPVATEKIRVMVHASLAGYSRLVEVEAWGGAAPTPTPTPGNRVNVALAANGAAASASSTINPAFPVASVINGDRLGVNWANGGGWNDADSGVYPDWVEVAFDGTRTIDEIGVFTLQDNFGSPTDPTAQLNFSLYGITSFYVQFWDGTAWQAVPGGIVTGNGKVWTKLTFTPVQASKIRVVVNSSLNGYSRIVEIEAWGT